MEKSASGESVSTRGRLLLVDGHAYAYRAFFAIRGLSSPAGRPTNAIYGFIRMLGKVMARVQPTHVLVAWDGGLAAERMALLPEYKAQRPEMPGDLEQQLDQIVDYLRAAKVASHLRDGQEADDCIAALAAQAVADGLEVVIATSDKDFMQLVSARVFLANPTDKTEALMGVEEVKAKTGVEPTQIVDWLSLIGDAADNIPGAPGIGPKTAGDLLRQFGSINAMFSRLAEVSSERVRNALQASTAILRRNQELIRLKAETACDVSLEELSVKTPDDSKLRELYAHWGFRRLLAELEPAPELFVAAGHGQ